MLQCEKRLDILPPHEKLKSLLMELELRTLKIKKIRVYSVNFKYCSFGKNLVKNLSEKKSESSGFSTGHNFHF